MTAEFRLNEEGQLKQGENLLNRGMLYGDGFFESMRWHDGKIVLKHLHEERIMHALQLLQMDVPAYKVIQRVEDELNKLNPGLHARVRLNVIREGTGFYAPDLNKARFFVSVQPLPSWYTLNEKGLRCIIYRDQTKSAGKYSVIKSISAQLNVMASLELKRIHADEAVLLNSHGRLAEGSGTNVFLVHENKISTPAGSEGCVEGVFRRFLTETARQKGYKVQEKSITEADLQNASELWFTSSIRGLMWAGECDGVRYTNELALKLFPELMQEIKQS
jgi:branched-chain amino acid aminotransferase